MTIREAKDYMENEIRCIQRASYCDRDCAKCNLVKEEEPLLEAFGMAIKALEEIQQYRAIGTVKEIKIREAQFARLSEGYLNDLTLLREYQAIGTIEEFKALKEDKKFLEFLYNQILPNEMEQYLSMYRMKDKVAISGYADQSGLMPAT